MTILASIKSLSNGVCILADGELGLYRLEQGHYKVVYFHMASWFDTDIRDVSDLRPCGKDLVTAL